MGPIWCPRYMRKWVGGVIKMQHVLTLAEQDISLWLSRGVDGYVLHHGGQTLPVALHALGDDRYSLKLGQRQVSLHLACDGDHVHLHVDGVAYEIVLQDAIRRHADAAAGIAANAALAPMPGRVIATPVAAGDVVKLGDVLIIIESMKLETAIKAQRAGVVDKVLLEVGQTFERDATLVSLVPVSED